LRILPGEGTSALPAGPDSIMLQQLKEKFEETTNKCQSYNFGSYSIGV
jgi:hypothetical protein